MKLTFNEPLKLTQLFDSSIENGYLTGFSEDGVWDGPFQYRLKGFSLPPTGQGPRTKRGSCLSYLGRHEEAVQVLKEACNMVEKLPEDNTQCKFQVYYRLAEARLKKEPGCPEAIEDATKALRLINKVHGKDISCKKRKLEEIIACMKS